MTEEAPGSPAEREQLECDRAWIHVQKLVLGLWFLMRNQVHGCSLILQRNFVFYYDLESERINLKFLIDKNVSLKQNNNTDETKGVG
ncbi:hypothetical protein P343_12545 [Sporolactobacillus laevolacticus DSM 442]|uniref:Uncharacterized protein n=1 Tax=Sporolactobacillus laevolacticus DSM 442 TaxID=1395513 RepID=V6J3G6_9BACL|nr:hypothetical protein P343_12545 [Sporolactobacillus laevolacticus DSM 442]